MMENDSQRTYRASDSLPGKVYSMRKNLLLLQILLCLLLMTAHAAAGDVPVGLVYSSGQYTSLLDGKDELTFYRAAIEKAGGAVVVLSPRQEKEVILEQKAQIKALILPGGIDIDPKFYNEEKYKYLEDVDTEFDEFEFSLIRYCVEKGLPIMGICRGHQLLTVYFGGSLYQDIPSQYNGQCEVLHRGTEAERRKAACHFIRIEQSSALYQIMKTTSLRVNSSHHQATKKVPAGFLATAWALDGTVEAIERKEGPYVMGVQFHPERLRVFDPRFNSLFIRLVNESSGSMQKKDLQK